MFRIETTDGTRKCDRMTTNDSYGRERAICTDVGEDWKGMDFGEFKRTRDPVTVYRHHEPDLKCDTLFGGEQFTCSRRGSDIELDPLGIRLINRAETGQQTLDSF